MTAAAVLGMRQAAVLEHLRHHPDLTAGELERFFGLRHSLLGTLRALEQKAHVVAVTAYDSSQGRQVSRWHVAPPGTVPPPARVVDPREADLRRERDTAAQRRRRRGRAGLLERRLTAPRLLGAACASADPDLFFGPDAELDADGRRREAQAKAICAGCPAQAACLAYALDTGQGFGIWGGTDEVERRAVHRRQERRAS